MRDTDDDVQSRDDDLVILNRTTSIVSLLLGWFHAGCQRTQGEGSVAGGGRLGFERAGAEVTFAS
jgi:hypothetical protein